MAKQTPKQQLTDQQMKAIDALIGGANQTEAATVAGCERHSIGRWLRTDAQFIAEYNSRRYAAQNDNAERLRNLGAKALDTVESLLKSPDEKMQWRAAALVLQALGLDKVTPLSADDLDPRIIEERIKVDGLSTNLTLIRMAAKVENDT